MDPRTSGPASWPAREPMFVYVVVVAHASRSWAEVTDQARQDWC